MPDYDVCLKYDLNSVNNKVPITVHWFHTIFINLIAVEFLQKT